MLAKDLHQPVETAVSMCVHVCNQYNTIGGCISEITHQVLIFSQGVNMDVRHGLHIACTIIQRMINVLRIYFYGVCDDLYQKTIIHISLLLTIFHEL